MALSVFLFFAENVGRFRSVICCGGCEPKMKMASVGFGRFFAAVGCKTKPNGNNFISFFSGNRKTDPKKLGFALRKLTEIRFFGFRFTTLPLLRQPGQYLCLDVSVVATISLRFDRFSILI